MKLLIASDIHGSAYYCRKMLEAYEKEGAQRMLLLGDILYHGPRNDLPKEYAPKEVIRMLNEKKNEIYAIRGNCEAEVDQMVLQFPVLADYMILFAGERAIYATHGHVYNENQAAHQQLSLLIRHFRKTNPEQSTILSLFHLKRIFRKLLNRIYGVHRKS